MLKTKFLVIFLALLVLGMSVAVAADVDDSTSTTKKVTKDTTKIVKNAAVTKKATKTTDKKTTKAKENTKTKNTKEKTITKNTQTKSVKRGEIREVNNTSFDDLFTSTGLGSIVNPGDTLNFVDNINRNGSYIVDKPVTILGNNKTIELNTINGYNLPTSNPTSFNFVAGATNTNVSYIHFHNTQVFVNDTSNIVFDHINVTNVDQGVGKSVGVFSIRDGSTNITVKNSDFLTKNNTGCSNLVLAYANNCTIENNTIIGMKKVGNLLYTTTYNTAGVNYMDTSVNQYNYFHNNRIYGYNITGGVCIGVVVSGHNNTYEGNNVSVSSAFSGQWISPTATYVGNFSDAYEGNSYIDNRIYGSFTGTKNSTITDNKFFDTVSIPERCKIKYNNASTVTVTITGPNCCLKGNTINQLVVKPAANVTYICTGNTFIHNISGEEYTQPCNCSECNNINNILLKNSDKIVKTDSVSIINQWFTDNGDPYMTLYSNGTLVVHISENVIYPWGIYGGAMNNLNNIFGYTYNLLPMLNNEAANYEFKDIVLDVSWSYDNDYPTAFLDSSESYENLENVNSFTINWLHDYKAYATLGKLPFKKVIVNNMKIGYFRGSGVNYNLTFNHATLNWGTYATDTEKFFKYENSEGIIKFVDSTIDSNVTSTKAPFILNNASIIFKDSTLNFNYQTDDETYEPTVYAINSTGNLTLDNNDITITNYKGMFLDSNSVIQNNYIETPNSEYCIELAGSDNDVEYNILFAKELNSDLSVLNSGENNIIKLNLPNKVNFTIISADNVNINEKVPITILAKDVKGKLFSDEEIIITVGNSNPETVRLENGIYTYYLTPTEAGNLTFKVEFEETLLYLGTTETKEINVIEDKDAIINNLNKTIQEQEDVIETLNNQTQALNNTVSQLEKDLTEAQEQLANNNNTNTNGTSSNNGTSNTNGTSSNNGTSNTNTTTPTKTTVTLKLNPTTIYTGSKTKITATLKDANGKAVASQKISIKVGTKTYTVKTNKKGVATKTVKVTKTGKNKVTATFKATNKYAKTTKSATLTVKTKEKTKITVTKLSYKNKKITIKATIKAGNKALTQNTKLTIKVDGKTLTAKKTSKKGKITLTLKKALKKGSHKIQIISKATSMYKQTKIVKTLKIVQ